MDIQTIFPIDVTNELQYQHFFYTIGMIAEALSYLQK